MKSIKLFSRLFAKLKKTDRPESLPEHWYEHIMKSINDGVVVTDTKGQFLLFNPKAIEILGTGSIKLSTAEWNKRFGLYYPDSDRLIHENEIPFVLALKYGESSDQFKMRLMGEDGTFEKYISVSASPLYIENNEQKGAVAVFRDITLQQQLSEQLLQSHKMEAIGLLAGGVAHDFNNKLGAIILTCDFLIEKDDPNMSIEGLKQIREISIKAGCLTKQLLTFSRKQVMQTEIIDIDNAITESYKLLKRLIGEDIKMDIIVSNDALRVVADKTQLDQILINLCVNARDAMPKGGSLSIETKKVQLLGSTKIDKIELKAGDYALVQVKDTGCGIPIEIKDKIFEPFFTTKEIDKGTGLGLSTVHGIVKQHGGEIIVTSNLNVGTTFSIYLPIQNSLAEPTTVKQAVSSARTVGNEKILLVEDDEYLLKVTSNNLRSAGFRVVECCDALKLPEILLENLDICLLLTDLIMPAMNGNEVAKLVEQSIPGIPVIFMSGYTHDIIEAKGLALQDAKLLYKPVTLDTLLEQIKNSLKLDKTIKKSA